MRGVDHVLGALASSGRAPWSWLVGDPCVSPPTALREAFIRAARAPDYPYAPPAGRDALRAVLAARHGGGGRGIDPAQVVVTAGAKPGLFALLSTLLEPGDELLHPRPCYPGYPSMARTLGARPVPIPQRDGSFADWIEEVGNRIGPATRAVVLSSPSNPTGATLTGNEAERLTDRCRTAGVRLICDEAYHEFRYGREPAPVPADFDPARDTVVQIRSASKAWAVCGWRIGWVVADSALAARVAERHVSLFGPASGPAQHALESLDEIGGAYMDDARTAVSRRLDRIADLLERHRLPVTRPSGGFYLWVDIGRWLGEEAPRSGIEWCASLARSHGVGLWPGDDFGGPRHVRLAVTAPVDERWEEATAVLDGALHDLARGADDIQ